MNIITDSNVILETNESLEKTFNDLQKLKEMEIANNKSRILHNGELLPAGAYNDYDTFINCYYAMSDIKCGNFESFENTIVILMDAIGCMPEEERLFAFA